MDSIVTSVTRRSQDLLAFRSFIFVTFREDRRHRIVDVMGVASFLARPNG